MHIVQPL